MKPRLDFLIAFCLAAAFASTPLAADEPESGCDGASAAWAGYCNDVYVGYANTNCHAMRLAVTAACMLVSPWLSAYDEQDFVDYQMANAVNNQTVMQMPRWWRNPGTNIVAIYHYSNDWVSSSTVACSINGGGTTTGWDREVAIAFNITQPSSATCQSVGLAPNCYSVNCALPTPWSFYVSSGASADWLANYAMTYCDDWYLTRAYSRTYTTPSCGGYQSFHGEAVPGGLQAGM